MVRARNSYTSILQPLRHPHQDRWKRPLKVDRRVSRIHTPRFLPILQHPNQWRADATKERIKFIPGLIPNTMRWTNRSTFQQAIEFGSHR